MKEIAEIMREWRRRRGEPLALATLVRTHGSSYRRRGARMLICWHGETFGSLSGGCLEEEVALRAREVLRTREPACMDFDTRLRFGCHGRIEIFVEALDDNFLAEISSAIEARQSCRVATVFSAGATKRGSRVLRFDEEIPEGAFSQELCPPLQVLICGEGPDSVPLRDLCGVLGWRATNVRHISELPDAVDPWAAAIVMTHNYGRDFAALRALLPLNLRYVGIVGPRRRRDQLLGDLLDAGITMSPGLFAPAGIDLNAETPEEIALAIVTEIQSVFAGGSRTSLRDRKSPIHVEPAPVALSEMAAGECEVLAQ